MNYFVKSNSPHSLFIKGNQKLLILEKPNNSFLGKQSLLRKTCFPQKESVVFLPQKLCNEFL